MYWSIGLVLSLMLVLISPGHTFAHDLEDPLQHPIKLRAPHSESPMQRYVVSLLKSSLRESHLNIELLNNDGTHYARIDRALANEFVDVIWRGSSPASERQFKAIPVPIFGGLLGYRVPIIRESDLAVFSNISETNLKKKVACQGAHWPDSDILEANGYKVLRAPDYKLMFRMLAAKRCDYFPRSVIEAHAELASHSEEFPELVVFSDLILHYRYVAFLYMRHNDYKRAEMVHQFVAEYARRGEMTHLLQTHPITQHVFPLSKWGKHQIFRLDNPLLTESAKASEQLFWLSL